MLRQTDDGRGLAGAGTSDDKSAADVGGYGHELLIVQVVALHGVDFPADPGCQCGGKFPVVPVHESG